MLDGGDCRRYLSARRLAAQPDPKTSGGTRLKSYGKAVRITCAVTGSQALSNEVNGQAINLSLDHLIDV